MKRCPQCGREYDNSMAFCLDDGVELLYGPTPMDGPPTAILHETDSSGEAPTRAQIIHTTDQTAVLPTETSELVPKARSLDKRLLAALFLLAIIVLSGAFSYRYFKAAQTEQITSIAVLPFQNRSDDADTDYLSDGLAESLIFRLTQLPGLRVSPTSSVIRYKGKETDVSRIASELGVDAVMTGWLIKRGDNLNITVELVDARSNRSLWGEQYERKMADLLATQREIAATIAQKLQPKLRSSEPGVTKKYTDNNDAYELYLKGRFHFARRSKLDLDRSVDLLQQATKLDPNFALAYVGIAEAYSSMTSFPYLAPKEAYPLAKAAVIRALELDPDLPEAHAVAGMIAASYEWDYAKADREFKRAIELNPDLALTHFRYGWTYLSPIGRHDEAIASMKRAMELEPLSVQQGSNYSAVLLYARRFDEALEQGRKTYELDPSQAGAQNWLCHPLNAKGMYQEAIVIGERAAASQVNAITSFRACLGYAYAKAGQREKSLAVMKEVKELGKSRYISSYWTAIHFIALGDKEAAFADLEDAFEKREWFLNRLKVDPFMDPLRGDPRFDAMIKRLNLPE